MTWTGTLPEGAELRQDQHSDRVEQLQFLLVVAMGISPGALDGIFGPKTQAALLKAQHGLGVEETGVCARELFAALRGRARFAVRVEDVMTPASWAALRLALEEGYQAALGREASRETILVLGGILAEEHGANFTAIHLCNLGNHQVRRDERDSKGLPRTPYFLLPSPEVIDGVEVMRTAPYPAYGCLGEGAAGMLRRMRDHHARVITCSDAGDADGAAKAMHDTGWFTGNLARYRLGVVQRSRALALVS